ILVVDDTPLNLKVIRGLLKQTQISVVTAESGAEALSAVAAQDFDVIFLDHLMPDMDGIETVARLRNETRAGTLHTPVICLTANAVSGAKEAYIEAGFTDYLTKPIESAKLEAMLLAYLPEEKVRMSDGNGGTEGTAEQDETTSGQEENVAGQETQAMPDSFAEMFAQPEELPQWLSALPGVDAAAGVQACGFLDTYLDVLKTCKETLPDTMATIKSAMEGGDWRAYTIKVHAIKSSLRIIGDAEGSAMAAGLEAAGNAQDEERIRSGTPELLARLGTLSDALNAAMQDSGGQQTGT
ncbi:MAG: response regulator, partial [Treponema sp.]|nr:response regulator [Treponema sp.]